MHKIRCKKFSHLVSLHKIGAPIATQRVEMGGTESDMDKFFSLQDFLKGEKHNLSLLPLLGPLLFLLSRSPYSSLTPFLPFILFAFSLFSPLLSFNPLHFLASFFSFSFPPISPSPPSPLAFSLSSRLSCFPSRVFPYTFFLPLSQPHPSPSTSPPSLHPFPSFIFSRDFFFPPSFFILFSLFIFYYFFPFSLLPPPQFLHFFFHFFIFLFPSPLFIIRSPALPFLHSHYLFVFLLFSRATPPSKGHEIL